MLTRRDMIVASAALASLPTRAQAASGPSEDGLYHQDWFLDSFLDFSEDLAAAHAKGKRFAVLWGLKGCPACKRMHEEHFSDAGLVDYIRARFDILHLNILGAREVIDFDGRKLGEKALSQAYGIRGTPAFQFFPRTQAGLEKALAEKLLPEKREVARMPGLLEPKAFLSMFRYVFEEGYRHSNFVDWMKKDAA